MPFKVNNKIIFNKPRKFAQDQGVNWTKEIKRRNSWKMIVEKETEAMC